MADSQGLDPALLAERQGDEETELNQLRLTEVEMQLFPKGVVGEVRVPRDRARPGERRLLPLVEPIGCIKLEQLEVLLLGEASLSGPDRTLSASVLAVDRFRDVNAAKLLDLMVANPVAKDGIPRFRERPEHIGNVRANRLALGTRRPVLARMLEIARELRVRD